MPRMDKTGPLGKGALTGRGMGDCNEDKTTPEARGFGGGFGGGCGQGCPRRRGCGAGRGRAFNSPISKDDQK